MSKNKAFKRFVVGGIYTAPSLDFNRECIKIDGDRITVLDLDGTEDTQIYQRDGTSKSGYRTLTETVSEPLVSGFISTLSGNRITYYGTEEGSQFKNNDCRQRQWSIDLSKVPEEAFIKKPKKEPVISLTIDGVEVELSSDSSEAIIRAVKDS